MVAYLLLQYELSTRKILQKVVWHLWKSKVGYYLRIIATYANICPLEYYKSQPIMFIECAGNDSVVGGCFYFTYTGDSFV